MRVNFISSKDTGETRTIYVWSDNVRIMRSSDTERVCNNHDSCHVDIPKEHEKIKYLPGEK